jgi:hypothetical protein
VSGDTVVAQILHLAPITALDILPLHLFLQYSDPDPSKSFGPFENHSSQNPLPQS